MDYIPIQKGINWIKGVISHPSNNDKWDSLCHTLSYPTKGTIPCEGTCLWKFWLSCKENVGVSAIFISVDGKPYQSILPILVRWLVLGWIPKNTLSLILINMILWKLDYPNWDYKPKIQFLLHHSTNISLKLENMSIETILSMT